ncbi:MAG: hypothetical protein LBU60_01280 [Clostridiales bacterium]|jgi:hypothetical protein|nr:hypothetical protein [Clostridiales bacterium]
MSKYQVSLDESQNASAKSKADSLGISVENYIARIVHNHLDALHSMKQADFKEGYAEYSVSDISNL